MKRRKNIDGTAQSIQSSLLENSPYGYYAIDRKGRYVYVNKQGAKLANKTQEEMIGKTVKELFPQAASLPFGKAARAVMKDKKPRKIEEYYPQFNTWFENNIFPIPQGICVIAQAISPTRQADIQMANANAVIESSGDAIITIDPDGIVSGWNSTAKHLYGYSAQEIIGKPVSILTPPNKKSDFTKIIKQLLAGRKIRHYQTQRITKSGKIIDISLSVSPIKNKDGKIIGASKIAHDITKQKEVEKNLQRNEENFKFLSEASKILSSSLDYKTTLANVTKSAIPFIADWSSVDMLSENGDLESLAISHKDSAQVTWATKLRKKNPPNMNGTSGVGHVIKTGKAEVYPYVDEKVMQQSARDEHSRQLLKKLNITSVMIVPIILQEKAIGTISFVITNDRKRYNQNDLAMAKELAYRASLAIENAMLYKRIQRELEEKKKAEEENAYFSTLLDYTSDAIIISELRGKIIYWNKGAANLYGYTKEEALGNTTKKLLHTIHQEQAYGDVGKDDGWEEEIQHITKYKQKIIVESKKTITTGKGRKKYILEANRDITGRREIEDALRQSEERLQLALEVGRIGVWDWDIVNDMTIWTKQMYKIHGFDTSKDLRTDDLDKLIYPEDRELVEKVRNQALKKQDQLTIEHRIITPNNDLRWLMTHALISRNKLGKPIRMVGAVIDMTEQKNLEQDKNDFISIATHELKTPVTSLKAYAEVLQRKFLKKGDEFSSIQMGKMNAQLDKLTSLIADLLDATKIEAGKLAMQEEIFAFDDLVKEIVEEMQRTTDQHKLMIQGTTNKSVYADRERIGQVITNLVSNAIKYSPTADKVNITLSTSSSKVLVCVQDFGVGIQKSKQKYVFERFYRVSGPKEKTFPGLGLGLYISSEIVKRQQGKIWVESEPGKGSRFYFSLPISK